jgi:hypothetical protein
MRSRGGLNLGAIGQLAIGSNSAARKYAWTSRRTVLSFGAIEESTRWAVREGAERHSDSAPARRAFGRAKQTRRVVVHPRCAREGRACAS